MRIGFLGAGSMAQAMARGWAAAREAGDPAPEAMLFADAVAERAGAIADEVGGDSLLDNAALAEASDLVVLAVKPADLDAVATELSAAPAVLSLLGATSLERLAAAMPDVALGRLIPNIAVEVRSGSLCLTLGGAFDPDVAARLRSLLGSLGSVHELDDALMDAATAVMACSPAYLALAAGAIADAGAADGLDPHLARQLVAESLAGTALLLERHDPDAIQKAVASPGGSTEAGLAALEDREAASAFAAAVAASLERMRP